MTDIYVPKPRSMRHTCIVCGKDDRDVRFGPNSHSLNGLSTTCVSCWQKYKAVIHRPGRHEPGFVKRALSQTKGDD